MKKLRIANSNYLNSVAFSLASSNEAYDYSECAPSAAAAKLLGREVDVALVPTAEFLRSPELHALPFGIIAHGEVKSVVLLSRCPLKMIDKIYIDEASRTSVVLLRLLLEKLYPGKFGEDCFVTDKPKNFIGKITDHSAALIIGDYALYARKLFPYVHDLGEMWFALTSLPFPFAIWAITRSSIEQHSASLPALFKIFTDGTHQLETLGSSWVGHHSFSVEETIDYLHNIRYAMDRPAFEALDYFATAAADLGLIPKAENSERWQILSPSQQSGHE
ncbi:MAG: hypothetical protein PHC51_00030 [bacterium]|nr:hypothetical protein [bacterium]